MQTSHHTKPAIKSQNSGYFTLPIRTTQATTGSRKFSLSRSESKDNIILNNYTGTVRSLIDEVNDVTEEMKHNTQDNSALNAKYSTKLDIFRALVNQGKLQTRDIPQIELLKDKNILAIMFASQYAKTIGTKNKASLLRYMKHLSYQSQDNGYKPYENELTAGRIALELKEARDKGDIDLSETEYKHVKECLNKQYKADHPEYLSDTESEVESEQIDEARDPCHDVSYAHFWCMAA